MKTQKKNASRKQYVAIRVQPDALRNLRRAERAVTECASAIVEAIDNAPMPRR